MWDKAWKKIQKGEIKDEKELSRSFYSYPMKIADNYDNITVR
jgi:hypothetical protein